MVALHDQEETATMEILPPAEFALEGLETPESITEGETANVAVTVTNVGGGADDAEVALTVGGEPVDTRSVTLAAEVVDDARVRRGA